MLEEVEGRLKLETREIDFPPQLFEQAEAVLDEDGAPVIRA